METVNYIMYLDNIGRLLMGTNVGKNGDLLYIKNPVIIHVTSTEKGGINIQFFPVMFREFQADKNESTTWEYTRNNITVCQPITFEARLIGQYQQMFAPIKSQMPMGGAPAGVMTQGQPVQESVKVLKLFDE